MIKKMKPKSEFGKNTLSLVSGNIIAQSIPMILAPILTRIYTPEEFVLFATFMSIVGIFMVIATGKYEMAIVMPEKDKETINIFALSILITIFISILSLIIVSIFNEEIVKLINHEELKNWLFLIPISVLVSGFLQTMNLWQIKKKI